MKQPHPGRPRPFPRQRALMAGRAGAYSSPWHVAALVAVVYAVILGSQAALVGLGSFVEVGTFFTSQRLGAAQRSAVISHLPGRTPIGYDGQFAYYIALDPLRARSYLDDAPYRYGRILYPLAAWLLALGEPAALPYTLIAVNLLAVVGAVWLLAGFLRRHARSAWWAAVYGFFPPLVLCALRDLSEPLALLLACWGFVLAERGAERVGRSAALFALAALARETTIVFPLLVSARIAFTEGVDRRPTRRSLARAARFGALSLGPALAYRLLLRWWLHGWPQQSAAASVPFGGLGLYWPFDADHVFLLLAVVVPGTAWFALAAAAALRHGLSLPLALVIANALLFVVFLPGSAYVDYASAGRATAVIVLAAIVSLPTLFGLPRPLPTLARVGMLLWTPAWVGASVLASGIF